MEKASKIEDEMIQLEKVMQNALDLEKKRISVTSILITRLITLILQHFD